jgi:hypothetical protein
VAAERAPSSSCNLRRVKAEPLPPCHFNTPLDLHKQELTAMLSFAPDSKKRRLVNLIFILAAVWGLDGGFTALDCGMLQTMTEWLQRQLKEEAACCGCWARG